MLFVRRAQPWLGTMVELAVVDSLHAHAQLDLGFAAIARVHQAMSPMLPDSDIGRFHTSEPGASLHCDPWTITVLQIAKTFARRTQNAFDVSLGSGHLGWSVCDAYLQKNQANVRLDLGGIAKGFAVDRAVTALQSAGAGDGWVNAGGDMAVFGAAELPVHVRLPSAPGQPLPLVLLQDGAIATSVLTQYPGLPAPLHPVVTVAAPQCVWADALTKIVGIQGIASRPLLAEYHACAWLGLEPL